MRFMGLVLVAAALLGASGCGGDVTTEDGSSGGLPDGQCASDADCTPGREWCVGGACVPCDNEGLACDIACEQGWSTYERNGCYPCACAPVNECTSDADCGAGQQCYTGSLCWDWCPPGDPSCCFGNTCSGAGCAEPNPSGCHVTGCPEGQQCTDVPNMCSPSSCSCAGSGWMCTADCSGGRCVTPL